MTGFQFNQIKATTKYCGVLGFPIKHSGSPAMHNPAMEDMGLDWNYLAFEVPPNQLKEVLNGAKHMGFVGMNLTVPHKLLALDMMDHLDASAKRWGAVNTVRFEGKSSGGNWVPVWQLNSNEFSETRMIGYNTDANAVIRAIKEDLSIELNGKSVILLGAGGAGRVAALKLADEKVADLYLVNRTVEKCHELKEFIDHNYQGIHTNVGYPGKNSNIDLIINATSLGLKPNDSLPFDQTAIDFSKIRYAFDMIYQQPETPFLKLAKEHGCQIANGLGMLLYQGVAALEIWSQQKVPVDVMKKALHQHVYKKACS